MDKELLDRCYFNCCYCERFFSKFAIIPNPEEPIFALGDRGVEQKRELTPLSEQTNVALTIVR